jgi:hypothetical protein
LNNIFEHSYYFSNVLPRFLTVEKCFPLFSLIEQYFRAFLLVQQFSPAFSIAPYTWSAAGRLHDLGRHGGVKAGPLAGVLKGGHRDLLLRAGGDGLHPAHVQSSVTL